jgi:hypothetical protein
MYVGLDPANGTDPSGAIVETLWDAANAIVGWKDAGDKVSKGDYAGAAIAGIAAVVDTAAVFLPGVPGGVSTARRAVEGAAQNVPEITRVAESLGEVGASSGGKGGPDFVVTPKGEAIPVPDGASGPSPTINKGGNEVGFEFTGGSGGKGMDERVDGVRIMDANRTQGPRVNYMNSSRQTVDPVSGRTIGKDDPRGHLPLKEDPQ